MSTILVVEDEYAISQVLKVYLEKAHFTVHQAFDGEEAIRLFKQIHPSLVLLDIMLPSQDGWSILKKIREESACPVIMLTALTDINYKLSALNGGADDYIAKPFIGDEVIARVNAVLRRSENEKEDSTAVKQFGSLKIDETAHRVEINGIEVSLTPRDLSVLLFLANHPNQTFSREQLIEHVWGMDYDGSDRAVDLSIKRLRQSLHHWSSEDGEIKTIRGLGYQFSVYSKH